MIVVFLLKISWDHTYLGHSNHYLLWTLELVGNNRNSVEWERSLALSLATAANLFSQHCTLRWLRTPCGGVWCWPRAPLQDCRHILLAAGSVGWCGLMVIPLWELPSTESCFLILSFPFWEQHTFNHWPMRDRYKVPVPLPQLKTTLKGHSSQEFPIALAEGSASQLNFSFYQGLLLPSVPQRCISLEYSSINFLYINLHPTASFQGT